MRPVWLIEAGIYGTEAEPLLTEIRKQGMAVEVIPFRALLGEPLFSDGSCVIVYGTFPFTRQAQLHRRWVPGVWGDPVSYAITTVVAHYGKRFLSQRYLFLPAAEATRLQAWLFEILGVNDEVFARPCAPSKLFTGRCIYRDDFTAALSPACHDPTTMVMVAMPREVGREWRLLVVEDRVVTASQYASAGSPSIEPGCPDDVLAFAESMLKQAPYRPAFLFFMDICESEGGLCLVELSPFNSSWIYACDPAIVVREVSALASR